MPLHRLLVAEREIREFISDRTYFRPVSPEELQWLELLARLRQALTWINAAIAEVDATEDR